MRLRTLAVLAAPTLLLAGLGVVVAAVDGAHEVTGSLTEAPATVPALHSTSPVSGGGTAHDATVDAELRQLRAEVHALRDAVAELGPPETDLDSAVRVTAANGATFEAAPAKAVEDFAAGGLLSAGLLLREAARSATPFARELDAVAAFTADLTHGSVGLKRAVVIDLIGQLQPYAETGMATRHDLRRSFATVAAAIDRAQALRWWQSLLVLIGWRADPLAPVREAEAALLYDDLAGAVDSLTALTGEPSAAADGWLTLARARLAIDGATAGMYRSVLEAGGARAGPGDALASARAAASGDFE